MKRFALLIFALAAPALAQNDAVNGFCTLGASKALVSGLQSSNFQQGIIPKCTVTVYLTGTTNTATIFTNASGGTLSNPFTSTSPSGQWLLYAATGLHVDVVMSGGVAPNTYPSAVTLTDVVVGGGSGSGGSGFPFVLGSTTIGAGSTTTLLTGLTINGVNLNSGGSTSLFLNQAGGYSTPAGSGGSSIPGTVNQAIYSGGAGSGLASKATFDAAGNSKSLSNDGTFNAYLSQTTPTSNDGIKNALSQVTSVTGTGGTGMTVGTVALTIAAPPAGGIQATGTLTVLTGTTFSTQITNPGSGYLTAPTTSAATGGTPPTLTAHVGNTIVIAGNDYPCVEGSYGSSAPGNYILGIGVPAPFANGTTLINDRSLCGGRGSYSYNPQMGATGNLLRYDRIVANQWPAGPVATFFLQGDTEFTGSGINSGFTSGGPDSIGQSFRAFELMTRGIYSVDNIEEQAYSQGDNHLLQFQITNSRGSPDSNGEGFNTIRAEINQNLTPLMLIANSTLAAGATLIQGTLNGNVPFPGDGTYLIDSTRGGPVVQIINDIQPSGGGATAGQWQVNTTLTPDNIGRVAAGLTTIPIQRYGATTNATMTITGLTSALGTSQTACVADPIFQESARVVNAGSFSGGTATGVVLALRYPHQPSFYVAQGSHTCNVMEIKANGEVGSPPSRQLFRIIGAIDSTHYLYSRTTFGGWDTGLSGYAKTYDVANAGTTLTRNGSGVVTVPVSDGGFVLSLADVIVAGCSDSSFNGLFAVTSDTGTAVTWANAGAAGTTTCTKDIEVLSKLNNAFGIRDAQEFPAAEIVNTVDPVTFANNFNLTVEPNTNLHVIAGDQLENHPYADVIMGFDRNIMAFQSQTTPSATQLMHFDQISGPTPEGISWYRISFTDNPQGYAGIGGSKGIGANLINMGDTTTPFSSLFENMPVPTGVVMSFKGCVFGCADLRSQTTFFSFDMNGGSYFQTINQANHSVVTMNQNVATNEIFNKNETDQGLAYFTNNGLSGTSEQENFLEWIPGLTKISTASDSGSVKNSFIMTPTGTSFSQPITIIGAADGCATFITGVLNSTGVACGSSGGIILTTTGTSGPATLTGTTLNIPVYTSSGGGVTTYNTRSGAVVPVSGDYSFSLISGNLGNAQGPSGLTGILLDTAGTLSVAVAANFPTLNQSTTGSAAKWTTARNLAGNSVDGSANVAFANKFIVQGTTDAGLSGAQFLGALGTCLLKNTTTTGVLSCGAAGTDYLAINGSSAALSVATSSAFGVVKPDNTTITITAGVISAVGGGSGTVTTSGSPTTNTLSKFCGPTVICNSGLTDDGTKLTYTGSGTANGWLIPEGTAITGVALSAALYPDSTLHRWMQNPNNIGALMIPGIATAGTSGHLAVLAANGIDIVDGGVVPAGGGTVTAVSIVTANGISGSSSGGATPALTLTLGAITPTSTNGVSAATMAFNDATSSIQGQLNAKAPIASPTFTGTVTMPSGAVLATPASLNLGNATGLPTAGIVNNAVTSAKLAVVNTYQVCDLSIGDTSGTAITSAQLGPQSRVCFIPAAATIVEMDVNADGGTPNIIIGRNHAGTIFNIVSAALATAASGGIACSKTTAVTGLNGATTCSATLQNTSLSAGDYLELVSGTAGGTAKFMVAHIIYTVN